MFRIAEIELKNFIGLKKISNKDGIFNLSLKNNLNKEIIMIFGENGLGKTTLLENLTPYSNMLSREVKKSITYPAYKKIKFIEDDTSKEYLFEVFWEDDKTTKGYIHINGEILEQTSKGNITEFNYETNKLFGDFSKFKNSLFLQQGVLDIVKAKPSERVKIINSFMNELDIYNKIKENATKKIDNLKGKTEEYKEKIEELKGFEHRYLDLKKFEEEFDYEEFDKEKDALIKTEEKYLELSKKLSVKENIENEIKKVETELKNYENFNLEKQIREIDEALGRVQKEVEGSKDVQSLHQELLILNEQLNNSKNMFNGLGYLNDINLEETVIGIENSLTLNLGKQTNHKGLNRELLLTKEEIQNFTNKKSLLEDLKSDLTAHEQTIRELEEQKPEEPKEDFEEVISLLQNIENEGKYLRDESEEKKRLVLENEGISKRIKDINILNSKLVGESEKYDLFLKEDEKLKELTGIIDNTNENHECNSCGQEVNIDTLKVKIKSIKDFVESVDKKELFLAKTTLEDNQISLIQLEKEKEIKDRRIQELSKDYGKLLEDKKKEYLTQNKNKQNILKFKEYTEKVSPIKNKMAALSKTISELETTLVKPKLTLMEVIDRIEANDKQIELIDNLIGVLKQDLNILNKFDINKDKSLKTIISDTDNEIKNKAARIELVKKEYDKVDAINREFGNLKDKKSYLNEENAKYKTVLLKNADLNENLEVYMDINKEMLETLKNEYGLLKNAIEKKSIKIVEYKKDLELVNLKLEEYEKIKENNEKTENEIFTLSKIKNYSDRIKKASISEFFNSISDFINKIISSEKGTLSGMKIKISQKNNAKNFDILVDNNGEEVKDISLLSGAEQGTVARAIYFALAQFSNFGIIWLDECDGMLSDTNKEVFIEMLMKMKDMIGLNQIIFISHNKNLIYKTDLVIDLNQMVTTH